MTTRRPDKHAPASLWVAPLTVVGSGVRALLRWPTYTHTRTHTDKSYFQLHGQITVHPAQRLVRLHSAVPRRHSDRPHAPDPLSALFAFIVHHKAPLVSTTARTFRSAPYSPSQCITAPLRSTVLLQANRTGTSEGTWYTLLSSGCPRRFLNEGAKPAAALAGDFLEPQPTNLSDAH